MNKEYLGKDIYFTTIPGVTFKIDRIEDNEIFMISSEGKKYHMDDTTLEGGVNANIIKFVEKTTYTPSTDEEKSGNYFSFDDL